MNRVGPILALATVALAAACHAAPPTSTTETTSNRVLRTKDAATEIASAICKREVTCAKTGIQSRFPDRQSCMEAHEHFDLRAEPCPHGVAGDLVDRCAMEIANRPCHLVLTRIEILERCRRKDLCGKQ